MLEIIEEESKDEVVGLRRHVAVYKMSEDNGTIEEMVSWVRSERVCKRRATKSVNQDIRSMMSTSIN